MTLQTDKRDEALLEDVASLFDKRDEALLEDVASLFDKYAHDSETLAYRGLDLRRNTERAKVWREAAAEVRSIKLV